MIRRLASEPSGDKSPDHRLQGLNDLEANLVLTQQLRQRRHRLLVGHQAIDQADGPKRIMALRPNLLESAARITLRALAMIAWDTRTS